jgi:hypothetical protein
MATRRASVPATICQSLLEGFIFGIKGHDADIMTLDGVPGTGIKSG